MPADHILIAIHDFSAGGTELIAFRMARAWLAAGRRVTILAGAADGRLRDAVPEGAQAVLLDPPIPRSALSRLRLGKAMALRARDLRPDVVFLPGNFHFCLARAFRATLPDTMIVGKVSNPLWPGAASAPGAFARAGLRWWTKGIDVLAAMSIGLNRDVSIALPGIRVATIRDPFIADEAEVHARTGRVGDGGTLRLLCVGRLEEQKQFTLAIDALALLRRHRDATLTIVGEGSQRAALQRHIDRAGLNDTATLAGYRPDLADSFASADLLVVSSAYEGGPAVVPEALSAGLPFASTDCSHMLREYDDPALGTLAGAHTAAALAAAIETQAGRPFPTREQIASAVARNRTSRSARAYLALFDWDEEQPAVSFRGRPRTLADARL